MALIFCDGFDNANPDTARAKWDDFSATLEPNERGAGALLASKGRLVRRLPERKTFVVGFALKHRGSVFLAFEDRSYEDHLCAIHFRDSGVVTYGDKKRAYGSSAVGVFPPDVMSFFECRLSFSRWFGTVEARVDGIDVLSITFARTAQRGSPFPSAVALVASEGEARVSDFYICDTRGQANSDYLGDVSIRSMPGTRVESFAGQRGSRYAVGGVDDASSVILAAQVTSSLHKGTDGEIDAAMTLANTSQTSAPVVHRLSNSSRIFTDPYDVNPLSGRPWESDDLSRLRVDVRERA